MKREDKLKKQQPAQARRQYKTKEDFLRWLRKREALKKQAAKEQNTQAASEMARALMVWGDDGGSPA